MTTIIVTHENSEVDEFVFDKGQENITIGRRSTNDVCIPDLSVSGNHARLIRQGDDCLLEDLNSTNGTFVNGQVIQRQIVAGDDEIIIGKISLTVLPTASVNTPHATSMEQTPVPSSDFGDGHSEPPEAIDPLAMNQAGDGIEAASADVSRNDRTETAQEDDEGISSIDESANRLHAMSGMKDAGDEHRSRPSTVMSVPHAPSSADDGQTQVLELDTNSASTSRGAVIEIKNGAKKGQILPIDKPVTTLGRPGIQIAAIMRKPDGYFLMHIESDDSVERPTLNRDAIGDEPVLLHSGDALNVAGIDVEFMLS